MIPIAAAIAAVASITQKFQADAEEKRRLQVETKLHKQQRANEILSHRSQVAGIDTGASSEAADQNNFLRQLNASRRDASGDWANIAGSLGGLGAGIVDAASQPGAGSKINMSRENIFKDYAPPPTENANVHYTSAVPGVTNYAAPSADITDDAYDPERRSYLMSLARKGGY